MVTFIWAVLAVGLWGTAAYFIRQRMRRSDQETSGDNIAQQINGLFDTPEGILARISADPTSPVAMLKYADLARMAENWPEFLRRAQAATERFPKVADADLRVVHALWQLGQADRAVSMLRKAIRRHPWNTRLIECAVQQQHDLAHWDETRRLARRLRKLAPNLMAAYAYEADALITLGRLDAAEAVLMLAEKETPGSDHTAKVWDRLEAEIDAAGTNRTGLTEQIGR